MGFKEGAICKVWEAVPQTHADGTLNERWTKIRLTISRLNTQTGEYVKEFYGWVDVYGTIAAAKAAKLKSGDKIRLTSVDVTNTYNKEKETVFWNPKVFAFEPADSDEGGNPDKGGSGRGGSGYGQRQSGGGYAKRSQNGGNQKRPSGNGSRQNSRYEGENDPDPEEDPDNGLPF